MSTSTSKPRLYYMLESPPCRTVMAIARLIGVELELKRVDLSKKEQLNEEFVKVNPFHVVPTLEDSDGFVVWESRAIAAYLIQSRGGKDNPKAEELYPSELKKRITVDKFLQYDLGTLYRAISDVVYGIFTTGQLNAEKVPRLEEVLKTLESYISGSGGPFLTGDQVTLADISISLSLTMLDLVPPVDLAASYPAVAAWNAKVEGGTLKAVNKDGKFTEARANMKAYAQMLKEKALSGAH